MPDAGPGPEPQGGQTARIEAGCHTLEVGEPAGTTLELSDDELTAEGRGTRTLRRALSRRRKHRRATAEAVESKLEDASEVTSRIERAKNLLLDIASGRLDPAAASDEIDALISLLSRLSDAERWKEALRVARSLSLLLALVGRWIELVDSLRVALHAAERLGDPLEEAWALHELGTLHLVGGRHAAADRQLSRAQKLRAQHGDRPGLAATNRNLQVLCQTLRRLLHMPLRERVRRRLSHAPLPAVFLITTLIVLAGGSVVLASSSPPPHKGPHGGSFHLARVAISFAPGAPHADQSIVFTASASDSQDPVASYVWQWGDGDPSGGTVQHHEYRESGRYTVVLTVRDARGRVTGHAAESVLVAPPPVEDGPNASFVFQPRSPAAGSPVRFDASSSYDPRAPIASYEWRFGDGTSARGLTVSHAFAAPRGYRVALSVTDAQGQRDTLYRTVEVASGRGAQPAEVSLGCPSSSVLLGADVPAAGAVTPRRAGVNVTVTLVNESGRELVRSVRTDPHGDYAASVPVGEAGQWDIQASAAGGGGYAAASSESCAFSVQRVREETTISLSCAPSHVPPGGALTASGSITPPRSGAPVNVIYTGPAGEEDVQTPTSEGAGSYHASIAVTKPGTWTVKSSLLGDSAYQPSSSQPCHAQVEEPQGPKKETATSLECPSSPVRAGQAVLASGSITPARAGASVVVTYLGPSGEKIERPVASDADGSYSASAALETPGRWSVTSSQRAEGEYLPSSSHTCAIAVEAPKPKPTMTALTCPRGEMPVGSAVPASGSITPARAGVTVTVTYSGPSEEKKVERTVTKSEGQYSVSPVLDKPGNWKVQSASSGDSEYEPSTSSACSFYLYQPSPS